MRPGRRWWEYCQTASATMSGVLGSMPAKTSMPSFCEADEAVLERGFVGMGADEFVAEFGDGGGEGLLHRVLGGPADFVGGLAEVAVGDEEDGLGFSHGI
jgi:hypothetical protein